VRRRNRGARDAAGALALAAVFVATMGTFAAAPASAATTRTGRVLIVSLPNTEWADFDHASTPNFDRLFAHSALGAMVTNGVERPTTLPSGYVTVGAGARALGNPSTGSQGFGVDEDFGRDRAGVVFTTRTGIPSGDGLVYMPITDTIDTNDSELYGAEPGSLGDELATAGISRAVIANGDGTDPSTPDTRSTPWRRAAVAALMTSAGKVPAGRVDAGLLRVDSTAPFGVRLDPDRVERAFADAWTPGSVVLVEGSDLVRADIQSKFASDDQAVKMRARALEDTDRILGRLLAHVDADDMVMVIGPAPPQANDALSVASVRGPGFAPGLLRSTTTGHDGFVNLTDVAPTVLRYFGLDRPDSMEGRRMETGATGGTVAEHRDFFVNVNEDGLFRDGLVGPVMSVVMVVALVLAGAAIVLDRWARLRARWAIGLLVFGALWLLGLLDATYLAGPLHFGRHGGAFAYWIFVVGVGAVIAAACMLSTRRRPVLATLAGLGTVIALHLVDLVTGAHLEWNTVFGSSPTIGIRFVGQGNMTFAQLTAAAVLFAGLLAWQVPTKRGVRGAVALLAVTVIVMAAPFWGNDFGGAIAAAPGFVLLAWLLLGHELRWRTVWALVGVLVAAGLLVGMVDLLRPADQRTHVGKFFEKVFTDFGGATLVLRRKASENFSVLGHSLLLGALIALVLLAAYLWWVRPRTLRTLFATVPTACMTAMSLGIVALLGFALNDSGITIPGMMAAVAEATVVILVVRVVYGLPRTESQPELQPEHRNEPEPAASTGLARDP
jgi:hypothetical protein